jgi:hypothetical protein
MENDRFIEQLRRRAVEDAQRFRKQNPDATPNERWIENSFTAAVPIVADDAGFDAGAGPHPQYFSVYAAEVARELGMTSIRETGEWDRGNRDEVKDIPRGEG